MSCISLLVALVLPRFKKVQKMIDNINELTRENLTGIRVVRAFNAEGYQKNKFELETQNLQILKCLTKEPCQQCLL